MPLPIGTVSMIGRSGGGKSTTIRLILGLLKPDSGRIFVDGEDITDYTEDEMMSIIVETAMEYALSGTAKGIEIMASKLGDEAGITGGAVLARRGMKTA